MMHFQIRAIGRCAAEGGQAAIDQGQQAGSRSDRRPATVTPDYRFFLIYSYDRLDRVTVTRLNRFFLFLRVV